MMRQLLLIVVAAAVTGGLRAQPAGCRFERDIAYREVSGDVRIDTMCRLDICCPADGRDFATVVWFHGGGLEGGRREIPAALCGSASSTVMTTAICPRPGTPSRCAISARSWRRLRAVDGGGFSN